MGKDIAKVIIYYISKYPIIKDTVYRLLPIRKIYSVYISIIDSKLISGFQLPVNISYGFKKSIVNLSERSCGVDKKICFFLISVITLMALALRIFELGDASLWYDEILTSRAARSFLLGEGFTEPGGTTYMRSWLTTTLPISVSFAIFGVNEFAARLPSVFVGTLLIPIGYLIGKQVVNRHLGLLFSTLLAFDPWLLTWSQEARMYIHVTLLYTISIYIFYRWYSNDMKIVNFRIIPFLIIGLLGYNSHRTYMFIGPVILLFLLMNLVYITMFRPLEEHDEQRLFELKVKNAIIVILMAFSAILYVYIEGVPRPLTGYAPEWYLSEFGSSGRPGGFYWDIISQRSPFNKEISGLLFISGLVYLITRKSSGILYTLAFLLPFCIMSNIFFQQARYILFIYPIFLLVCISPIGGAVDYILKKISSNHAAEKKYTKRYSIIAIILIMVISQIFAPVGGALAFKDQSSNHGFSARPDHKSISNHISQSESEFESAPTIITTSTANTLWYQGYANYTTLNVTRNKKVDGTRYEIRTGVPIIETKQQADKILSEGSGWIIIDYRYEHANKSVINTLRRQSRVVTTGRENITKLRYYNSSTVD